MLERNKIHVLCTWVELIPEKTDVGTSKLNFEQAEHGTVDVNILRISWSQLKYLTCENCSGWTDELNLN